MTSVLLWERIHAAGLATSEECRQWAIAVAQSSSQDVLLDPSRLASELIKQGRLTSFQANVLFHNLKIPLVLDDFKLTKSLESELGKGWFETQSAASPSSSTRWLYLLTLSTLNTPEVRKNPPSLALANQTIAIRHPSLDRWVDAKITDSNLFAVCHEILGQSLSSVLKSRRLSWEESTAMIEQIAAGLGKYHDTGLVHGRINLSTVWSLQDGTFVLRRDPLFLPVNPFATDDLTCLGEIQNDLLSGAAPEFTLPASYPSIQSDLYALGCLWYASSANEPLLSASSRTTNSLAANQAMWARVHSIENGSERIDRNVPDRLKLCLARLLAKNPSDRFATARALTEAIDQALAAPVVSTPSTVAPLPWNAESKLAKNEVKRVTSPATPKPVPALEKRIETKVQPEEIQKPTPVSKIESKSLTDLPKVADVPIEVLPSVFVNETAIVTEANLVEATEVVASEPVVRPKRKKRTTGKKSGAKQSSSQAASGKKKKGKKGTSKWRLPTIVIGTCVLFVILIPLLLRTGSSSKPVDPNTMTVIIEQPRQVQDSPNSNGNKGTDTSQSKPSQPVDPVAEYYSIAADDGKALWAPPQAGSPYSTELLPAGLEAIVFLSGNAWHQRGTLSGLSKWWLGVQPQIASLVAKYPLLSDDRIDSVAIALYPSKTAGVPQVLFRVKMTQPVALESIAKGLQGFSIQLLDPKSGGKRGIWSDEAGSSPIAIAFDELATDRAAITKRLLIGPQELVLELSELNGGVAPLRRQLELLLQTTDSRADVTALFAPSFLFGDGRELISASPNLSPLIKDLIDESTQAVALSMFLESRWYLEMRMLNAETREPGRIAAQLKARLEKLPDQMEAAMLQSPSHPYWRALSQRYPQMLRSLSKFGRFGIEDGQVIANVYLPSEAASNLLITSWMAMAAPAAGANTSNTSGTKPTVKPPTQTIDAILESKISISFGQESLESALQLIALEVADSVLSGESFPMSINGPAFQKQGITQNQQIRDFKQVSVPLRTVLTDLVRRANPVTTVQSTTEKDQKVVWVIVDDPNTPAKKKIELTTRTWAESNDVKLSAEFVAP